MLLGIELAKKDMGYLSVVKVNSVYSGPILAPKLFLRIKNNRRRKVRMRG